jgi:hypothetical protein
MASMITDYIERHGLTKRDVKPEGQWIPASLLPKDRDDKFEIYANDNGTHVVALNTTRRRFKIVHGDLVFIESNWEQADISYETDARPFWEDKF